MNTSSKKLNVYKSSAGSGKTFTLVKEFLKLCLLSEGTFAFSSILAITFTNKATYEMKSRILTALEELSNGNERSILLLEILSKETALSSKDIQKKSHLILIAILHNYADFNISTIDRFSHRLIRTFAKDLDLSMSFQVQLDEEELLIKVIGHLIDRIGQEKDITKLLLDFAWYKIEEGKSWQIEKDLLDFSKNLLNENAIHYLEALRSTTVSEFKELKTAYLKANKDFELSIEEIGSRAISLIKREGIEDASFAGNSKISTYFNYLATLRIDRLKPTPSLLKSLEQDKWYSGKCTAEQKSRIDAIKAELLGLFRNVQDIILTNYPNYLIRFELLKNIHSLSLLNQIEKRFSTLKKQEKLLNISDFNRLISKVVLNEPMPFIYERLGERFRHLMIDEFQDTSVLQFMNLLPLIEDSLAKGNINLIVGDAKQAIYRFRGGEVEQFSEMPDYLPQLAIENDLVVQRLTTLKSQFKEQFLETNYRSYKSIISFNNDFFEYVKASVQLTPKVKSIFKEHQQKYHHKEERGYVAVSFTKGKKEEQELAMQQLISENINQCIEEGFSLSDIAILCRRKKDAAFVAEYLTEKKIDIISSEALLLVNSAEVRFLIHLARYVYEEENSIAQKGIIEFLYQQDCLQGSLDDNFQAYLRNQEPFGLFFIDYNFSIDLDSLKQKSINAFFEELIRTFQLNKSYDAFIQSLQDEGFDFTKMYGSSIPIFLEWWDQNAHKLSIATPEGKDAITIMTIHKSKGLEFPIVIYPFAQQKVEHSGGVKKNYLWSPTIEDPKTDVPYGLVEFNTNLSESSMGQVYLEELEKKEIDLVNDTYVAFTRAAERLYIHAESPPLKAKNLSLAAMLYGFINYKGLQPNEAGIYELGEAKLNLETRRKEVVIEEKTTLSYISNSWREKLKISTSFKWDEEISSQQRYGTLLHNILAKVKDAKDVQKAVDSFLLSGEILTTESIELKDKIDSIISMDSVKPYFQSGIQVKNEATLIDESGSTLRPDRVVFLKDHVAVIDYKTGAENDSYQQQLNKYIHAIAQITLKPVKGFILYTELEEMRAIA